MNDWMITACNNYITCNVKVTTLTKICLEAFLSSIYHPHAISKVDVSYFYVIEKMYIVTS